MVAKMMLADQASKRAVPPFHNVFARFAETGSARRVWLWFRSERLTFPLQMHQGAEIRWVEASYTAIHHVLTNPVYAGAYVYGKTRQETTLDAAGARKKRVRYLPRSEWQGADPGASSRPFSRCRRCQLGSAAGRVDHNPKGPSMESTSALRRGPFYIDFQGGWDV
jgi:hypothetical protein